jgi:putative tryptophan/tyrosine transport system substrate-binding protein
MHPATLTLGLFLGLLSAPLLSHAQQAKRASTIGFLTQATCPTPPYTEDLFRQKIRDLGYIEGQNIVIECRGAGGQIDRLPDLAAELVRLKVDVLVTQGTLPALTAKRATSAIPIVFFLVTDAVAS